LVVAGPGASGKSLGVAAAARHNGFSVVELAPHERRDAITLRHRLSGTIENQYVSFGG
jgi:hypothetical protein